jgi:surface glycoprotein (TIGR04207 family)
MTTKTDKIRSVFLTLLMVVSVFGGSIAFAGSVAANHDATDADTDSDADSDG